MKTQYYKLVLKPTDRRGLFSATVMNCHQVRYHMGRWTNPNRTARHQFLFAFTSRAKARLFRSSRIEPQTYQIFKCEVKNPTTYRRGHSFAGSPFVVNDAGHWPKGTVFVDCVKLTEKTH